MHPTPGHSFAITRPATRKMVRLGRLVAPIVALGLIEQSSAHSKQTIGTLAYDTASVIAAGCFGFLGYNAGKHIYEFFSNMKKEGGIVITECVMYFDTEFDGLTYNGYTYDASIRINRCDDKFGKEMILDAVEKCANDVHSRGGSQGCCMHSRGGGDWKAQLRFTADPNRWPLYEVHC